MGLGQRPTTSDADRFESTFGRCFASSLSIAFERTRPNSETWHSARAGGMNSDLSNAMSQAEDHSGTTRNTYRRTRKRWSWALGVPLDRIGGLFRADREDRPWLADRGTLPRRRVDLVRHAGGKARVALTGTWAPGATQRDRKGLHIADRERDPLANSSGPDVTRQT